MPLARVGALDLREGGVQQTEGEIGFREFEQSIDLASVAAASAVNADVTVTGLAVGDIPIYVAPAEGLTAGIIVAPLGPVGAANTLRLRVCNPTAAAVDAASATFRVGVFRP